jgi:multisubunit Na+/H+ antiporter MnhB subunit
MTDETEWKRRFLLFTLARVSGVLIIGLGLLIAFTGLLTPGGARKIGALVIVLGTVELAFLPHLLKQRWKS